ncbi:T6SS effector BTH_I2691 family protein [Pseudothauera lacus]|uniref:Toxin VasX N-terminal region domain-containing protein n=1 Tax=Pseudothauera lacus TaxID=2136175 RepID=A0A2T4IB23_9RHOO|nr:T6SS effector BTH_I2691 family protein [Pseudothauera lacus]PTD94969.1 hypothetical protein C8261_16895 [Pseudothauera lacus]
MSTTDAITQAAANATPARPQNGCPDCNKQGLAILPVIPVAIPRQQLEVNATYATLAAACDALSVTTAQGLQEHALVLRTLPSGYLYVLKPDKSWDAYVVDREGLLRMMPPAQCPASPADITPMSVACRRAGDNIPAQLIAVDPARHATVWIAFSRYRWTQQVMRDYADNRDGSRDRRLTRVDVMAAANGSVGPAHSAGNAVRSAYPMSAELADRVINYAPNTLVGLTSRNLREPLSPRAALAGRIKDEAARISAATAGRSGIVLALADDHGLTLQVNADRNAEVARLNDFMAEHRRATMISGIIRGFEESFTSNGQEALWNERFRKHYDHVRLRDDQQRYDSRLQTFKDRILALSHDVLKLNQSSGAHIVWRDFDPEDDRSAHDRQSATAGVANGSVHLLGEEKLWDDWLKEDPANPHAVIWGAVTALDADIGRFIASASLPARNQAALAVALADKLRAAVEDFRQRIAARANPEAMAAIGTSMASQHARIAAQGGASARTTGWRMLVVTSVRTHINIDFRTIRVTETQLTSMIAEATFGPPQATARRLLDIESHSGTRTYVVGTNGVDQYAFMNTQSTTQRTRVVELWLPDSEAARLPAALAGSTAAAAVPGVNPFRGLMQYTRSLPGVLAWAGLVFSTLDLADAGESFDLRNTTAESTFGLTAAILAAVGATVEIVSGALGKAVGNAAALRVTQIAFYGGIFGALAALFSSIHLFSRSQNYRARDDSDAADAYQSAAVWTLVSGISIAGGALAAAHASGALVGHLGFLAGLGGLAAAIPVWGWIALAILAIGAGAYFLWQAIRNTDTPLEEWLRGSYYGRGNTPFTPADEMERLNQVVYSVNISVAWKDRWRLRDQSFYDSWDEFVFSITLPALGAESVIDCAITLHGRAGTREVMHETLRPRMQGNSPQDPHRPRLSAPPTTPLPQPDAFIWEAPPRIGPHGNGHQYSGLMRINDQRYDRVTLAFSYWPDKRSMPNLVLPMLSEQRIITVND